MIKQLEDDEIEKVMNIWLTTNINAHNFIQEEYWVRNYDLVKNEYIPNSKTFVYKEDDIIKAFISILEDSFIGALFVLEEYQGQGIGKKLINYCKKIYSNLELAVYVQNTASFNFYKHCGFEVKKEQNVEDTGFSEYIMRWVKKKY